MLLALIAPVSYAVEASYLAWRGSHGLHPFQLLFGTALLLLAVCWPLAEITGQFSADDLLGEIFSRFCIGK